MTSIIDDMESYDGQIGLNPQFIVRDSDDVQKVINALKIDQDGVYNIEPGSRQFVFGYNINNPNMIHLHELFYNESDLEFHNNCQHMDAIKSLVTDPTIFETVDIPVYKQYRPTIEQHNKIVTNKKEYKILNVPGRYCLNVTTYVKDEYRTEFIKLMIVHQQESLKEDKCYQFDWGVSTTNSNIFYQHEQFEDSTGLDYHKTTNHFAHFMIFNKQQPYTQPQDVYHFVLL